MATEEIQAGDFVLEYKHSTSYPRKERLVRDDEYEVNGEGCFILEAQIAGGKWMCFNASAGCEVWRGEE